MITAKLFCLMAKTPFANEVTKQCSRNINVNGNNNGKNK